MKKIIGFTIIAIFSIAFIGLSFVSLGLTSGLILWGGVIAFYNMVWLVAWLLSSD